MPTELVKVYANEEAERLVASAVSREPYDKYEVRQPLGGHVVYAELDKLILPGGRVIREIAFGNTPTIVSISLVEADGTPIPAASWRC